MKRIQIFGFFVLLLAAGTAWAQSNTIGEGRVVSRERFNKVVKVLVDTVKRQRELEEQMILMQDKIRQTNSSGASGATGGGAAGSVAEIPSTDDSAIDLSNLDAAAASPGGAPSSSGGPHGKGGGTPHINLYFDFYLLSQPGKSGAQGAGLSFNNIHHFFLVEATAGPDIKFMTEVRDQPRFYELDYQFTRWFQLRLGKIWIPFDDLAPHNQFGGHMNVSRLRPTTTGTGTSSAAYLPDLWAEMGVAGKFNIFDREKFQLEGQLYIVNGFGSGGTDPVNPTGGLQYPQFSDSGIEALDNNRDKAIGGRLHAMLSQTVGIGTSYYTSRWTDRDKPKRNLTVGGVDAQLYFNRLEFRFGYVNFNVELPIGASAKNMNRPAYYAESSLKIGQKRNWKALAFTGGQNGDNRIVDVNDRNIFGGKLLYRPNNIEWGIVHFRDVKKVAAKDYRSFTAFRVIAMF